MMDAQYKKGILEACVLAIIKKEPSYGYKIVGDVSACIEVSESTLYPILRRLEAGGSLSTYTKEHNGRLRKYYQITPLGEMKIAEFLESWKQLKEVYDFIRGGE